MFYIQGGQGDCKGLVEINGRKVIFHKGFVNDS